MRRREALKNGLTALTALGLGTTGHAALASDPGSPAAPEVEGLRTKLAAALRSTGNDGCIEAAARLEASTGRQAISLHLRAVGLGAPGAARIADALRAATEREASALASFSLSYNEAIGDDGAVALARGLPVSLPELGLVGCRVGDAGGAALLEWAGRATRLRMLCIEGNRFSGGMRARFEALPRTNAGLSVFV